MTDRYTDPESLKIGIQGGRGSFNDLAVQHWLGKGNYANVEYLYSTRNVLNQLRNGDVHYGQFAIANSIGWLVDETMQEIGKYPFEVVEWFEIPIRHCLLVCSGSDLSKITKVMGHEQALRQCANTLGRTYPNMESVPGTDELVDNAAVAQALSEWKLGDATACIGSSMLATMYGLTVAASDIQDRFDNRTTFVIVKSPISI